MESTCCLAASTSSVLSCRSVRSSLRSSDFCVRTSSAVCSAFIRASTAATISALLTPPPPPVLLPPRDTASSMLLASRSSIAFSASACGAIAARSATAAADGKHSRARE